MRHLKPWRWGELPEKVFLRQGKWREKEVPTSDEGTVAGGSEAKQRDAVAGHCEGQVGGLHLLNESRQRWGVPWPTGGLCTAQHCRRLHHYRGFQGMWCWCGGRHLPRSRGPRWVCGKHCRNLLTQFVRRVFLNFSVILVWQNGHSMLMWLY